MTTYIWGLDRLFRYENGKCLVTGPENIGKLKLANFIDVLVLNDKYRIEDMLLINLP